jgi:hypothetical protein
MENSETEISLDEHNYPVVSEFYKKTPDIKLIIETYYDNNKLSNQTIIRKVFNLAKKYFAIEKNSNSQQVYMDLN